jgi:hypothetical protein
MKKPTQQPLVETLNAEKAVVAQSIGTVIMQAPGSAPAAQLTPAPPTPESRPQIAPTRLRHGAEHLFGREKELAALDEAWDNPITHILTIVAWGGVGKTSLVVEWMARKAKAGWAGFDRVFDWSFYSQGTREEGAASADAFIAKALEFFGDEAMSKSAASPWDKGGRLAQLVAQRRTLLVLDGVEPLQYPPGPLGGQLKDPALEALLKGLAQQNPALCVVTTRERVADLAPFRDTTAPQWGLEYLSEEAGAALLHGAGANRAGAASIKADDSELRAASREVRGHALTLRLLGTYLSKAHHGDIRKRDLVNFQKADAKIQGGHAFKTLGAYEKWFSGSGEDGARALAVLRLTGLFDRPADAGCLRALRGKPAIPDLTEAIVALDDDDWNIALSSLEECGLITVESDQSTIDNRQSAIDAHPLIREYFAQQLREKNLKGWRLAHRRLYEHLRDSTKDEPQPTLEDLQPLYQAVAHGCQAGLQQQACDEVYDARIQRGNEFYSSKKLGANGADLGAVACFFEQQWSRVSPAFSKDGQAWLLNEAATRLRALGRLTEALEPMRLNLKMRVEREEWQHAPTSAGNLSELELMLGEVDDAVGDGERILTFTERSAKFGVHQMYRASYADALHQAGRWDEALAQFCETEKLQALDQPELPLLYSVRGFRYCDLLLAEAERAAWQSVLNPKSKIRNPKFEKLCHEVEQRAAQTLKWATTQNWLLDVALDHLTLGRAALYRGVLTDSKTEQADAFQVAHSQLTAAVDGFRRAGTTHHIPRGLLSRAWLRSIEGDAPGAQTDLDEAWQIAERGPMRLFMADIHLYRARLFHAVTPYPWKSAKDDLAAARKLIDECGYHRRDEELADAERAIQ